MKDSETPKETASHLIQGLNALQDMPLSNFKYSVEFNTTPPNITTNIPTSKNRKENLHIMVKDNGAFKVYSENEGERTTLHKGDLEKTIAYIAEKAVLSGIITIPKTNLEHATREKDARIGRA